VGGHPVPMVWPHDAGSMDPAASAEPGVHILQMGFLHTPMATTP
jgi:hypothetical protein